MIGMALYMSLLLVSCRNAGIMKYFEILPEMAKSDAYTKPRQISKMELLINNS